MVELFKVEVNTGKDNRWKIPFHAILRDHKRSIELNHLEKHKEFVQVFKMSLVRRLAKKLALWQPGATH